MNYMKTVQNYFQDNLEDGELQVNVDNFDILEQALRLMDIEDDPIANQEIESSRKLKSLFGFNNCEILNVIDGFSSEDQENPRDTETDYSEEEKIATENFRMTAGNSKERNWRKFWHKTGFRRFRNKKKKR